MAMQGRLPPYDDHLWLCGICRKLLSEPRTLPCLHSFCSSCLQNIAISPEKQKGTVTCPLCKDNVDLSGISSSYRNYFFENALKYLSTFSENRQRKKCTFCALKKIDSAASSVCITCMDLLCEECSKQHTLTRLTISHQVRPLVEVYERKYEHDIRRSQRIPCSVMPHKECAQYYCKTCRFLICKECIILDHKSHEYTEIPESSAEKLREIKIYLAQLIPKYEETGEAIKQIQERRSDLMSIEEKLADDIEKTKQEYIKEISRQAECAKTQIHSFYSEIHPYLKEKECSLQENYGPLKHTIQLSSTLTHCGNDAEILSLGDLMCNRLKRLHLQVKKPDKMEKEIPRIVLQPSETLPILFSIAVPATVKEPVHLPEGSRSIHPYEYQNQTSRMGNVDVASNLCQVAFQLHQLYVTNQQSCPLNPPFSQFQFSVPKLPPSGQIHHHRLFENSASPYFQHNTNSLSHHNSLVMNQNVPIYQANLGGFPTNPVLPYPNQQQTYTLEQEHEMSCTPLLQENMAQVFQTGNISACGLNPRQPVTEDFNIQSQNNFQSPVSFNRTIPPNISDFSRQLPQQNTSDHSRQTLQQNTSDFSRQTLQPNISDPPMQNFTLKNSNSSKQSLQPNISDTSIETLQQNTSKSLEFSSQQNTLESSGQTLQTNSTLPDVPDLKTNNTGSVNIDPSTLPLSSASSTKETMSLQPSPGTVDESLSRNSDKEQTGENSASGCSNSSTSVCLTSSSTPSESDFLRSGYVVREASKEKKQTRLDGAEICEVTDCRVASDSKLPIISDMCWVNNAEFTVADFNNNVVKIFDVNGKFLWSVEIPKIRYVACVEGVVVCSCDSGIKLFTKTERFSDLNITPFCNHSFPVAKGLKIKSIIVGKLDGMTLKEHRSKGKKIGCTILSRKIEATSMVQTTRRTVIITERSSPQISEISIAGSVSTFYTHFQKNWKPEIITIDSYDNVYALDSLNKNIVKISAVGKFLNIMSIPTDGMRGLTVNSRELFLISDSKGKVYKFTWKK